MDTTSFLALSVFYDPNRSGGQSSGEVGAIADWSVLRGQLVLGAGETSASYAGAQAQVSGVRFNDTIDVRAVLAPTQEGGPERVVAASLRWIDENAGDAGPNGTVKIADWGWQSVGRLTTSADRVVMGEEWLGGAVRLEGASANLAQVTGNSWSNTIELGSRTGQVLAGGGHDTIKGGAGNDTLIGDAGNDSVQGNDGDDILWGGAGTDRLWGGIGQDSLSGGDAKDDLYGGDGNDTLDGGADVDRLWAGAGDDSVTAGTGNDTLWGDAGNDTMDGGVGADWLYGGDGNDVLRTRSSTDTSADTLYGGAGDDALWGSKFGDLLEDTEGANTFYTLGNDTVMAGVGNDTVYGGVGSQRVELGEGDDVFVDTATSGSIRVFLGDGNDEVDGEGRALWVDTGAGDDWVVGSSGNDSLYGGDGSDTLEGGRSGYDRLFGGDGSDVLVMNGGRGTGGQGVDIFVLDGGGRARYAVVDFSRSSGDTIGLETTAYDALASDWQDGTLNGFTLVNTAAGFEMRSTTSPEVIVFEGITSAGFNLSWFQDASAF